MRASGVCACVRLHTHRHGGSGALAVEGGGSGSVARGRPLSPLQRGDGGGRLPVDLLGHTHAHTEIPQTQPPLCMPSDIHAGLDVLKSSMEYNSFHPGVFSDAKTILVVHIGSQQKTKQS